MKNVLVICFCLCFLACGYTQRDGELVGQVKKVAHATPLICPDYIEADISLGVLRAGVGSMSTQDVWLVIPDKAMEKIFREANESGALVKVRYDEYRVAICSSVHWATSVEIIK